jgi:DNA-binding NarL/FixJ family response regulator
LTASIEDLAQRARIRLRPLELQPVPPSAARDLGLTPRETEVLGHLAVGETDREIAEALFISKKTASVHVSNLLRKLDASSRIEAGRIGRAHGLGASVAS